MIMATTSSIQALRMRGSSLLRPTALTRPFSTSSSRLSGPNERTVASSKESNVPSTTKDDRINISSSPKKHIDQKKNKSVLQADVELRERMEKMSGDGGAAGIEYEDGKPNTMKRSVRNNMFRLI